ncbi:MAG: hypothetical protein RI907_3419 [Pseudomonadota bacterium]|jgi:site-specific recombinase
MQDRRWAWRPDRQTWWPRPGNGFELADWLDQADPQQSRTERNIWLIRLFDWVRRGEPVSGAQAVLGHVQGDAARRDQMVTWLRAFWADNDLAALLADGGLATRASFRGEWAERVRRKFIPLSPDNGDLAQWFDLLLKAPQDAGWVDQLDDRTLDSLGDLLQDSWAQRGGWREPCWDALAFLAAQVRATGLSPAFRLRLELRLDDGHEAESGGRAAQQSFRALAHAVDRLHAIDQAHQAAPDAASARVQRVAMAQEAQFLRGLLDQCAAAAGGLHGHLDRHGVSLDLVFQIDQLQQRCERMALLLDVLMAERAAPEWRRLVLALMSASQSRRGLRHWARQQRALLARKVTERSAETGEHYITRDAHTYRDMLRKAAGGGAVLAGTTFAKFAILSMAWTPFWLGMGAGVNYALSFLLVQMLHLTVATKQPAMTAPALSARLAEVGQPGGDERFVDEVAHLMRSQVAGIVGNMLAVAPLVALVQWATAWWRGEPWVGEAEALYVVHSLTLLGPTLAFAAFTGVLLFASSILAGWVENWFVLHRVDRALQWNPHLQAWLGAERAARWGQALRAQVGGVAANVSLGLMLGLVPVLAHFMALPLDVRHVTLSTGQWAAAVVALGDQVWHLPEVWWTLAALPLTGVINVGVSFWLAWRVAVRARGLQGRDQARLRSALWRRLKQQPGSFLRPPKGVAAAA